MKRGTAWSKHTIVDDVAHPAVRELQAIADGAQDPAPDQLFHTLGRLAVVHPGGVLE